MGCDGSNLMAISRTVQVTGLEEVLKNLAQYGDRLKDAAATALYEEARAIEEESVTKFAPRDTSMLVESMAFVQEQAEIKGDRISVEFGYRGPYAARLHENPRAGRTGGWPPEPHEPPLFRWVSKGGNRWLAPIGAQRKHWASVGGWKFLETPLLEATGGMAGRIADRIRSILGAK